jgi:manganese/zinc/iron transport system permease protein
MELLSDYTIRTVIAGCAILGLASGTMGSYAVLRGQSLLGDAVSHAALPGIALAFLLTGDRSPIVLLTGALVTGWIASYVVGALSGSTRVKYDGGLATILAVFFGFGVVLLTLIQQRPDARQAGLDTFLFGQAATLLTSDVLTMGALSAVALIVTALLWKEFKLLSFDVAFARAAGFPTRTLDAILTSMIVVAIVVGLQAVGVVLMSAMLVAPAVAARQWTDRLSVMVFVAGLIGVGSGVGGTLISSTAGGIPTGPSIVLCASLAAIVSLLLAPRRGVVWNMVRMHKRGQRLNEDLVLLDLYRMASQHEDLSRPHSDAAIDLTQASPSRFGLRRLERRRLVQRQGVDAWSLTEKGIQRGRDLSAKENGR